MSLAALIPVLGRPHRVEPTLESLLGSLAPGTPRSVLFLTDPGDVDTEAAIDAAGGRDVHRLTVDGNYAKKINVGAAETHENLLFLGADDLRFEVGWLRLAAGGLDERVGVVGVNDLMRRRNDRCHQSHFLVARWYLRLGTIDEPYKLLHEGYPHEYVDDEFIATAKRRGAYRYVPEAIVEHLHPSVGKAETDALYLGARKRMKDGHPIFERRRAMWE